MKKFALIVAVFIVGCQTDEQKGNITQSRLATVLVEIEQDFLNGENPNLDRVVLDAWNTPIKFKVTEIVYLEISKYYTISLEARSAGKDKLFYTNDDIVNTRSETSQHRKILVYVDQKSAITTSKLDKDFLTNNQGVYWIKAE
jgi:hypothetical protein